MMTVKTPPHQQPPHQEPVHLENRIGDKPDHPGRQYSPTAARNSAPIAQGFLPYVPVNGRVLEIASGTGEHALHLCDVRPDISWQPSDPEREARESQSSWRTVRQHQIAEPLNLNMTAPEWWAGLDGDDEQSGGFSSMFCSNMIHIAPWEAALGLAQGAGHILQAGQFLGLYGPFLLGDLTAPSNQAFDENLKSRNPLWGVRELESVKHIFADAGFNMTACMMMPKENRLIIFEKSPEKQNMTILS